MLPFASTFRQEPFSGGFSLELDACQGAGCRDEPDDRRARRPLLYVAGSNPPALWRASIKAGGLIDRRRVLKNSALGAVAW